MVEPYKPLYTAKRKQTTIRLTIRANEELEKMIRDEAVRRGTNVNQTMLYILNEYFTKKRE